MSCVVGGVCVVPEMDLFDESDYRADDDKRADEIPKQPSAAGDAGFTAGGDDGKAELFTHFVVPVKRIDAQSDDRKEDVGEKSADVFAVFIDDIGFLCHIVDEKQRIDTERDDGEEEKLPETAVRFQHKIYSLRYYCHPTITN